MIPKLFLSESLDRLADQLMEEIDASPIDPMTTRLVLVPNPQVREWLLLEIAKKKGIAMGLKVVEVEQAFPPFRPFMDLFSSIYSALSESKDLELLSYLEGKKKRLFDLSCQLLPLFQTYGKYPYLLDRETGWQVGLFKKLFLPQEVPLTEPVICFGVDDLPLSHWQILGNAPSLSIYLFSPCMEFWEDLSSDRERKSLNRYWKKRGVSQKSREELDRYLREGPKNLANWGKVGRATLKNLDSFSLETEEIYSPIEPTSLLKQIQFDLLNFQEPSQRETDSSIRLLQTGSSKLREVEAIQEEILRLDIPYHEISVLAPDIEPYVPLIEYVFGDIPYRISGLDISKESSFKQGLLRLLQLGGSRWEAEEILSLFETPSFYRKRKWDAEALLKVRDWISAVNIRWGRDAAHQSATLEQILGKQEFHDDACWEKGLDALLEAIIYLKPLQIHPELFEELLLALTELKNLDLKGEKTLPQWADSLEKASSLLDLESEADAVVLTRFRSLLLEMRTFSSEKLYPIEVVQHFLSRPSKSQLHASQLHAVRFSSIEEGAMLPAKALFLIGMDEISFPRLETPSSLDLLRGKIQKQADLDRSFFLQSIFSAKEILCMSYGHLSADEGKPVGPSCLIQELLGKRAPKLTKVYHPHKSNEAKKKISFAPFIHTPLPEGFLTLTIAELKALSRHPWKFFLQRVHKIYLQEELEETFALQRGKLVRASLERDPVSNHLPRPFKTAMELEVLGKIQERERQLKEWQIEPFSLFLRENCAKEGWDGPHYVAPPLEISWENLKVKLIGEIKEVSLKGLISPYEDTLAGTLKIWPEAAAAAAVLNVNQICVLRSGKQKSIQNPLQELKSFIEYYFHSLKAPSPLLPEWADPFLRKGVLEFVKKVERGARFEDPVMEWVFSRMEVPSPDEMFQQWGPFLKRTLQGLIDLYPSRESHAKV